MNSRANRAPTVDQLLVLAGRAGRKALTSAEVRTLQAGVRALAESVGAGVPQVPARRDVEAERLLAAAVRLYAGAYGLSMAQAEGEIRQEAGL